MIYSTLYNLPQTAQKLLTYAGNKKIWRLEGEMGVGKTTLIKAVCARLGVADNVTSPTFSLIHEYATASGEPVYHFDFYRIKQEEEALALDCMAYFDSGSYCFLEWPCRIPHLIPAAHCKISLTAQPNGTRVLQLSLSNPP